MLYSNRYTVVRITVFMVWFCCLTPLISYACSDEERAEMLKAGISPEYIKKSCEIEGLESQPSQEGLKNVHIPFSENADLEQTEEQVGENDLNFEKSEMRHQIMLMIGTTSAKLELGNGRAELAGSVRQFVYFHLLKNEIIAGFRHVSMRLDGNLNSSGIFTTDYTTTYKLEGFGFSVGRKFELNNSTVFPNFTYMFGDAEISVGPFRDLVTGTGDYLAFELPFLWNYQQILFGITPHYIIVGGSKNEDVRVELYSAFSLQVGIAF